MLLLWPGIVASAATLASSLRPWIYWAIRHALGVICLVGLFSLWVAALRHLEGLAHSVTSGLVLLALPTLCVLALAHQPTLRRRRLYSVIVGWLSYLLIALLGITVAMNAGLLMS